MVTSQRTQTAKTRTLSRNEPLWYKDAVIYQLHVKSFFDSNNDGVGDFPGLISKLDYIAGLGVNTIWLLPFYPSPRRDDGYDIADYRGVHPEYGSLADVRRFIRAAHERGLYVITELVVNHTSDEHPWFQRARRAKPGSVARDYYVWSDNDQAYSGTRIIFCDTEKSNWTWDPVAKAYFWHRFYSHQPDLNYDNPHVLREVISVMRYWLDMGVDGLRLDAVPYLVEREGTNNENLPETHAVLKQIRAVMDEHYPDRLLLAEANQWPEDAQEYFGEGDECHMSFHFPLMPRMYMAIARADRFPITDIMRQTPEIPENCQWAIFLRNHDELTLEMVTSNERDYLWDFYAADRRARINLGIRRRLAPLMERDRRRIELMKSLLFSMPGTPVLYYGDEIGMGDNIHLGDRDGVRTPMQWTPDRNGGFSRADPERLLLPVLMGPLYGYEAVNVEAQERDPHSLLNWTRRMLAKRQQTHAFGRGELRFLYPGNRKVLAYLREYEGQVLLCVANLSNAAQPVELELSSMAGRVPVELLGGTPFPTVGELPYMLTLPPYGFYWFDLSAKASPPGWHVSAPDMVPEFVTLVMRRRATGHVPMEGTRNTLCKEVLPAYLQRQRWFSRGQGIDGVRMLYSITLPKQPNFYLAEFSVKAGTVTHDYFIPLALSWEESPPAMQLQHAMARIRGGAEVGYLTDAGTVPAFALTLLDLMRQEATIELEEAASRLEFRAESGLAELPQPTEEEVDWFHGEQSNSSILLGQSTILKLLRHVVSGLHPEAEMTRYLTRAGYSNSPALLGEVARVDEQGRPHTLALLHERVPNQGDAWGWTLDYLKRTLESAALTGESELDYNEELAGYISVAHTIGLRLGELHGVLAQASDDPAFNPEVAGEAEGRRWAKDIRAMFTNALQALRERAEELSSAARNQIEVLIGLEQTLLQAIDQAAQRVSGVPRIRIHGDFHLGQVLISQNDVYLIDFEGEPVRSLDERRSKSYGWRDVAGLMRSFDYAVASFADVDALTPDEEIEAEEGERTDGTEGGGLALPDTPLLKQRRNALLAQFRESACTSFLSGYREGASQGASQLLSGDQAVLLDLALLEKAAYEVCYEAAHRPQWIPIPLAGLTRLAHRLVDQSDGGQVDG